MSRAFSVRRRTTILAIAALALVGCGDDARPAPPPAPRPAPEPAAAPPVPAPPKADPSHGGKPLADWLTWLDEDTGPSDEALEALRAIGAPAIAAIVKRADDPEATWRVRHEGLVALAALGPSGRAAVIDLCHSATADVRCSAVLHLPDLAQPGGDDVVDEIGRLLVDEDGAVRRTAAIAFMDIHDPGPRVLDLIVSALDSKDGNVSIRAAAALLGEERIDDAKLRARIEEGTRDASSYVRRAALEYLGYLRGDALLPALPTIVAAVDDPDRYVAMEAINLLGEIGAPAHDAAPAVARRLEGASGEERDKTTATLRRLGWPEAVALMIENLRSPDRETRFRAADDLGDLGPVGRDAIPALLEAFDDPDKKVRQSVTYALGDVGPGDPRVRGRLLRALGDPSEYVVTAAATRLGRGFAGDVGVRDALVAAIRDPKCEVPGAIAQALAAFGDSVAPVLVEALAGDGRSEGGSWGAVGGAIRKVGPGAAPALRDGLSSKSALVRERVLGLYAELKPPAVEFVPLCEKALGDESPKVRGAAADALSEVGTSAAPALPRLRATLGDDSLLVRTRAAAAVWNVSHDARGIVEALVEALEDEEALQVAASPLAEMGAAAVPAATRIARILERDSVSPYTRDALIPVLRSLGPAAKPAVKGLVASLHGFAWCSEQTYDPTPAIEALAAIGPDAAPAVEALRALRKETPDLAPAVDAAIAKIEAKK